MNAKIKQQIPYYAVIFTSLRTGSDNGYGKMAQAMEQLASKQKGFLGIESVRDNKIGITISYWESLEDIDNWKENSSHKVAQERGEKEWYKHYNVRVCKVERDYFYHM
ncbi:antibiotic biosynthesis monooxygenase [Oceanobacillus kimchii]|uniref:antibiotic biosynthesis monooxygenase family protein n=1 Tax=Oceanobacillus kimchii TaxID=746691 RepID=UPI000348CCB5|nr:antibiotic biosynthesis monooxygenase [Oceanobacillus kimchii]MCT1576189.1 antibiotic biosynthesis monooxygenase [Oceanobacillus kimchii]MCT2135826.1 antibiotic biosynthesis monooxygenase [Oceanobacillus kimchii]